MAGVWLGLNELIATQQMSLPGADRASAGATLRQLLSDGGIMRERYAIAGAWPLTWPAPDLIDRGALDPLARAMRSSAPADRFAADRLNLPSMSQAAPFVDAPLLPASITVAAPWYNSRRSQDRSWDDGVQPATGVALTAGTPWIQRSVVVLRDLQQHFLQIGTYGMHAEPFSGGRQTAGTAEARTDLGVEANYRLIAAPGATVSNIVTAHSLFLHENRSLAASNRANGDYGLDIFRAGLSWDIADTVMPSIEYFHIMGSVPPMPYLWPGVRRNSTGVIAGVTYFPWNHAASSIQFLNLRFAAQYVTSAEFNGSGRSAGGNGVYLGILGALHF